MSRPTIGQMQRAHAKRMARVWTQFKEIPVTDKFITENKIFEHCQSMWVNSRFEVMCFAQATTMGAFMQVAVRRHADLDVITWEDMNRIKNEVFSPDSVALEMYPPADKQWKPAYPVRIMYVVPTTWDPPFGLHHPGAWGRNT